jgi:hypothetical protein
MEDTKNNQEEAETESDELDDVVPVYANNVRFEMTAWDLRLLFGQLMPNEATPQTDEMYPNAPAECRIIQQMAPVEREELRAVLANEFSRRSGNRSRRIGVVPEPR